MNSFSIAYGSEVGDDGCENQMLISNQANYRSVIASHKTEQQLTDTLSNKLWFGLDFNRERRGTGNSILLLVISTHP